MTLEPASELATLEALRILNLHWREEAAYTAPNPYTYPWQWLWDSCFHALLWGAVGDRRAIVELESAFRYQRGSGFVPHMGYQMDPEAAVKLWGVRGSSIITQPPMYGHVARCLTEWGFQLSQELLERMEAALEFLWTSRRSSNGLLSCFHPWEAGTDDSPRWDAWIVGPFDRFGNWRRRKAELVDALELDGEGAAVGSSQFVVQPASFNALAAFNMLEFSRATGSASWERRGRALSQAMEAQWDPQLATWTDASPGTGSSRVRTLEALLGVLVSRDPERVEAVWRQVFDPRAFHAPFGPRGVHLEEPAFDPDAYWRGTSWPQVNYLLWVAARRQGRREQAVRLADQARAGAWASGHAEYWNPDTGQGRGAAPQSWSALWLLMDTDGRRSIQAEPSPLGPVGPEVVRR